MFRWLVIALVLAAFACPSARAEDLQRILESQAIKIGVCLDAEPSGYRDSDGQARGYDVDVATLVAQALGVRLDLVQVTIATRVSELVEGRIDVLACNITATTERAKTIDFSFPYLRTGTKLLVQRSSGISGLADIGAATRLLVGRGTTGETFAHARIPSAQLIFVENAGEAELLLRLGEAEAFVDDSLVVDYMAKSNPDRLVSLPETYSFDAISFGVRKGNPELLRWLDLFASIYVSSGKYAEIYGKWWGEPPAPLTPIW